MINVVCIILKIAFYFTIGLIIPIIIGNLIDFFYLMGKFYEGYRNLYPNLEEDQLHREFQELRNYTFPRAIFRKRPTQHLAGSALFIFKLRLAVSFFFMMPWITFPLAIIYKVFSSHFCN